MKKTYNKEQYKLEFFATTVLGFGAPPAYTIVRYPVTGVEITGICMKMFDVKNIPVKN